MKATRPAIKQRIRETGFALSDLETRTGIRKQNLSAFLLGHRNINSTNLDKILRALNFEGYKWKDDRK